MALRIRDMPAGGNYICQYCGQTIKKGDPVAAFSATEAGENFSRQEFSNPHAECQDKIDKERML